MRVMLDTNILISALVFGGKTRVLLEHLLVSEYEIFISEYVYKEFCDKLRLKWPDKADMLISIFSKMNFNFCKSSEQMLGKVRDKKDIPVLSDAIFNQVDVLLTGDKDFLESDITHPLIFSPSMLAEFLGI